MDAGHPCGGIAVGLMFAWRRVRSRRVVIVPKMPVYVVIVCGRFLPIAPAEAGHALVLDLQSYGPQVRRGDPLSLSISISGGEETYKDSPSNGERTGSSPA